MNKEVIDKKNELKVYADFLKKMQEVRKNSDISSKPVQTKTKTMGPDPRSGGLLFGEENQKGYVGAVMLLFVTALLETLFLLLCFTWLQ